MKSHEQEMEHAFAVQKYAETLSLVAISVLIHVHTLYRSEGKSCGICMEVVLCKASLSDRRFGILSKPVCN